MEAKVSFLEPLIERAEEYSKTSIELLKLKSVDKTADVASTLLSRSIFAITIFIFVLTINTALALWLGEVFGKNYYGFLIVAAFYALTGLILYFTHPGIKARISNSIIAYLTNALCKR